MIDRARCPRSFRLTACLLAAVAAIAGAITTARAADVFSSTGSMPAAREHHQAIRLPNGTVLVAGGSSFSNTAAFLYNPATGTFSTVGTMTTAPGRTSHTLTLLSTGRVLVAAGWNPVSPAGSQSSAQLYNPATGTFSATGSLAQARNDHTATLLPSGQVLIAAGQFGIGGTLSSCELYTPATGLFSATGSLTTARYDHVAAALPDGRVLVTGGYGPGSAILSSAEVYNPATGTWSPTGSLITGRTGAVATSLADGRVLVVSGRGTSGILASAEIYDPVAGTFSAVPMLAGRLSSSATLLADNRVLVAGGGDASGPLPVMANPSAELFDPVTGTFAAGPAMITPRMFLTATRLTDGRVLLAGGERPSQILASAELFVSCPDADSDGYGACQGDCDDNNPQRFPGNPETCDGIDNDCDLVVDEDGDGDGAMVCTDCDDSNPARFPGNTESCDGLDNDCDLVVDEDGDGDGATVCTDCDDANAARFPGNDESCDGFDNDCDGTPPVLETDADSDGHRICAGDCDDSDPDVFPGAGCVLPVRLNEILYDVDPGSADPLARQEWVELFNAGIDDVDLTGWVLTDRSGTVGAGARALPSAVLPAGAYLVVHVGPGANDLDFSDGCGAVYTGDAASFDLFDDTMDEAALHAPSGIQDFIGWRFGATGYLPGTAHDNAVAGAIWTAGTFLNTERIANSPMEKFRTVKPGTSIGRDKDSTDTDTPSDWDAHGGEHANRATPCDRNLTRLPMLPGDPPPGTTCDSSFKQWTVMVYMVGDTNLEPFVLEDLEEMETAGGSDPNVNVVVMADGRNLLTQASLGPGGELIFDPATTGGTFRFCVGPQQDPDYALMINRNGDNPYLGERNMADPAQLSGFITWAQQNFPAQRYALIVWGHGAGWKGVGIDETSHVAGKDDWLFMGELSQALAGRSFELIGFDACMMAMIEVAHQVQPYSRFMVASEEVEPGDGWPYDVWLAGLKGTPAWNGQALGNRIVQDYDASIPNIPDRTLSCVDQSRLLQLSTAVSNFAADLRGGLDDFLVHDDIEDNVERRVELDRLDTESFSYRDYMDIHHFVELIRQDPIIPLNPDLCYKARSKPAFDLSLRNGPVIVSERHGPAHPNAHGLSIYMPEQRTDNTPHTMDSPEPYDDPGFSRINTAASRRAMYAPNTDCLPFLGRDVETGVPLPTPPQWPLLPTPNFQFRIATTWDEFLMRYYHPVADNRILHAICPDGIHFPVVVDPVCGNPIDHIFLPPMVCTVFFSGVGSSDADTLTREPIHWMWDFDAEVDGCPGCLAPYEVPPGADASTAGQDMDAERTCSKAPLNDEKDADDPLPSHDYCHPGRYEYLVTLNAWDDNHEFEYHDTLPTASFVHTQTDDHISRICCNNSFQAPPPQFVVLAGSGINKGNMSWIGSDGLTYDVIKGSLNTILGTDGDFTAAVLGCVEDDGADEAASDPALPAPGTGWFYLVRSAVEFGSPSTYDEGGSQVGLRDAEIGASAVGCP